MDWDALSPSDQVEAADWIRERLHGFAVDVGSVIPEGFAAYARIFHPAWRGARGQEAVRWSEIAASTGRAVHPEMQFHMIAAPAPGHAVVYPVWRGEPRLGVLPESQVGALAGLLSTHTTTRERCWFCLWDGYGYLHAGGMAVFRSYFTGPGTPPVPEPIALPAFPPIPSRSRRLVRLPARDYLLYTGAVEQSAGWPDGPNLWWPEDRSWCVASEIDFPYTYVGGSDELIAEVLEHPLLEALPSSIHDGITADSDRVNTP